MAEHQRGRELVLELDVIAEVLDERHHHVDRGHLGSRARGDDLDQPEVVDVLVGQDDELDLLDRVPERRQLTGELVQRLAGVGARVDQGQRLVLDQVAVDSPDRERGRDPQPVDPGLARRAGAPPPGSRPDQSQHLVALSLHVLPGDERLEVEPQERLGVRWPHVEVPLRVVDGDAVQPGDLAVGVALGQLRILPC